MPFILSVEKALVKYKNRIAVCKWRMAKKEKAYSLKKIGLAGRLLQALDYGQHYGPAQMGGGFLVKDVCRFLVVVGHVA